MKYEAEFKISVKTTREFIHVRCEALQDNSPRHNTRVARFDRDDWASAGGFIAGFMGLYTDET